jgi:hypothetical protein
MKDELELELLLSFDEASYQASEGYVVEFTVRRTDITAERPHGISYALGFPAGEWRALRSIRQRPRAQSYWWEICEGTRCLRSLASRRTRYGQTLQVYDRFAAPR